MKVCTHCGSEITDRDVREGNCYHRADDGTNPVTGFLHKKCYHDTKRNT